MYHFILLLAALSCSSLSAAISNPLIAGQSPLPPGRLICAFHELADLGDENPTRTDVGALTMRTAAAIQQQAGIMVISPALWHNLNYRRLMVNQGAQRVGSKYHSMTNRWQNLHNHPSNKNFIALHNTLKNHPSSLNTLFLWHLDLGANTWHAFVHTPSSMIVLIPKTYIDQRLPIVPRLMSSAFSPLEYATGLRLSQCSPIELPAREDERGLRRLLRQAKQLHSHTRFSVKNLSDLFLSTRELTIPFITSWHVYAMGHGMMHAQRSEWGHLKNNLPPQVPEHICGLPLNSFRSLLGMFDRFVKTDFLYYQSCYGGGHNLAQLYSYNTQKRHKASNNLSLCYPLVAGALADAPVTTLMPRYTQQSLFRGMQIIIDINLNAFFDQLVNNKATLPQILRPVSPPIPSAQDLHAISGTPLVLFPGTSDFIPVDVLSAPAPICHGVANEFAYTTRAGIATIDYPIVRKHRDTKQPLVINNKRAILLAPFRITPELIIHPYRPAHHIATQLPELPPALVSIMPGNSIHQLNRVTLRDSGLRSFLLHSFMQLVNQNSSKVYLIENLTVDNDLQQNFSTPHKEVKGLWGGLWKRFNSWWSKSPEALNTKRLTLYQVVIYVQHNRVDCYFVEPRANGHTLGRHVTYRVVKNNGKSLYKKQREQEKRNHLSSDTIKLKLATISGQSHRNIYNKYRKLFNRQKVGGELSGTRLAPPSTAPWKIKEK